MSPQPSNFQDIMISHVVLLEGTTDSLQLTVNGLPDGDARDKLWKSHQELNNILGVMKTDLGNMT
jgi:hypothetical protein